MLAPVNNHKAHWHVSTMAALALGAGLLASLVLAGPPTQAYQSPAFMGGQQAAKTDSPAIARFCNPSLITIPEFGVSPTYPSTIEVSGLDGTVSRVTANLYGIGHDFYGDMDMLLAGPQGQSVVLMSDACDICHLRGMNLTFDDGMSALPRYQACPVSNAVYRPTNYKDDWSQDRFPPPAPQSGWSDKLSVLNDTDPNGTWKLYVVDDRRAFYGQIAGGWCVNIETSGTVTAK